MWNSSDVGVRAASVFTCVRNRLNGLAVRVGDGQARADSAAAKRTAFYFTERRFPYGRKRFVQTAPQLVGCRNGRFLTPGPPSPQRVIANKNRPRSPSPHPSPAVSNFGLFCTSLSLFPFLYCQLLPAHCISHATHTLRLTNSAGGPKCNQRRSHVRAKWCRWSAHQVRDSS